MPTSTEVDDVMVMMMGSLCCCIVPLCIHMGMTQPAELQQNRHRYFSLVSRLGMKQRLTVVGQTWLVWFAPL